MLLVFLSFWHGSGYVSEGQMQKEKTTEYVY